MKLIFITESLGSGGAERQLTRLAVLFKNAGHEVNVVTWGSRQFHAGYLRENGVEHLMIPDYPKVKRIINLAKLFRTRKPDAVISYLPMANETAIIARGFARVPRLIVSERSFTTTWSARTRLRYFLYRFADRVIANSNNEAENICSKVPGLKNKTLAIPNFVEIDKFVPAENPHLDTGTPIRIVSVGRVIATKNVLRAMHALKNIINAGYVCTLDWYGDTYGKEYILEVERLTEELGLKNHFFLRGETSRIHQILPDYDIFFFPSLLEGYPNALCEAMACGLPAVSSNAGEMPYILDDGRGGFLCNPYDTDSMTSALRRILDLTFEQRKGMGIYNRAKIVANNSPQKIFQKYFALI